MRSKTTRTKRKAKNDKKLTRKRETEKDEIEN